VAGGANDHGLITGFNLQAHVGQFRQVVLGLYRRIRKSSRG
jgi:hypothetical protein